MLQTVANVDQLWAALQYQEMLVSWSSLEQALSIVPPPDDKGPPEFYLSLDGGATYKPLTKIAAAQFGRLSGVRPAIYKEFVKDLSLTASMVHYSMNKPDRGGHVYVAHTTDWIVGVYNSEKPFIGVKDAYDILMTAPNIQYADLFFADDGAFEVTAIQGDLTQSVTPGLFMAHGGRPMFGSYTTLHDRGAILSPVKAPKKRKAKEACENAAAELVASRSNEAIGEADFVHNLAGQQVTDPVKFLSRLALMSSFSSQAADRVVTNVAEALSPNPTMYDTVRYVAGLAAGTTEMLDRRYQSFAHYIAFRGASVCTQCGLPQ